MPRSRAVRLGWPIGAGLGGVVAAPPVVAVPTNSVAPAIAGTAQVGQTLTSSTGTWTGSPTSFAYQWRRAGADIPGATASTYVPVSADIGSALTVAVTATNAGGTSAATVSSATSAVIAAAAALLAVGQTFTWVGDGLSAISGGVGSGAGNAPHQFQALMAGRVQPTALPVLAQSGTTIKTVSGSNQPWIMPYAIDAAAAQTPDIFILGSMGANDNVLSTNPVSTPSWLQDWRDAVTYAYGKFTAYDGELFVVVATIPSAKTGETTHRATVWQLQADHVASLGGGTDARVIFVPLTGMLPVTNYSIEAGGQYVHIDERGAYYVATQVKSAIDAKIENKTPAEIVDLIAAGTYPLMSGAQLDTDVALTGTAGTLTGPGITGTLASSKLVTNTTGATGITVAQVATAGGRTKTVLDFSAATAASAAGRVMWQDRVNLSVPITPGRYVMTGALFRASAGFWNFGSDFNGNLNGQWGGGGSSLAANGRAGAGAAQPMDTLALSNPLSVYGNSTTAAAKRSFSIFFASGSALSGTFELERPFTYLLSERTKHKATYIGDTANAAGTRVPVTTQAMRPTGTVSAASGGTIRVEPGLWTPRGMTEADFTTRRIYRGGTPGVAGVGTGTLLATLTGSTWTLAIAAGATTTGDVIYVEIDATSGVGPSATARSITGVTVT